MKSSRNGYAVSLQAFVLMLMLAGCSDASAPEASPNAVDAVDASPQTATPAAQPPLPDKAELIAVLRNLERTNLEIMAVAEKKAMKEPAPTFAELKGELLNYNSERALQHWETMYEQSPGWILEPQGLVFAGEHSMLASSFTVEPQVDGKVVLGFKTFGNLTYTQAHYVHYTLAQRENGDWFIDALQVSLLLNSFNREEALEAAKSELGKVTLTHEDEMYYYFKADQSENDMYVFHKKDGYFDFAPSISPSG
ncbi:hypothetical protein [Paenibacillus whitsoniae]|uniref:DUF4309 domain-containing protein n=1 Tax=Paenibacillus whitsoniae TaxID=2496558 RepID=A0A430JDP7_9BACL|nr:hypothetical protein [Paenibacillus whitsoniae]RTE09147.1 hypothetical protein EJQ19_13745 [Paenibacillus whitsoniae]